MWPPEREDRESVAPTLIATSLRHRSVNAARCCRWGELAADFLMSLAVSVAPAHC